ncbi:MAG: hypothetical protein ACLU38_05475 [Dysosmobacter sp.]
MAGCCAQTTAFLPWMSFRENPVGAVWRARVGLGTKAALQEGATIVRNPGRGPPTLASAHYGGLLPPASFRLGDEIRRGGIQRHAAPAARWARSAYTPAGSAMCSRRGQAAGITWHGSAGAESRSPLALPAVPT